MCGKILDRIFRSFLSFMILAGMVWFGVTWNPIIKESRATVTDRIVTPRLEPGSIPGTSWDRPRKFLVNGGIITVGRGRTEKNKSPEIWSRLKKAAGDIVLGGKKEGVLAGFPAGREQALKLIASGFNPAELVSAFLVLPRKDTGTDVFAFSSSGLGLKNFLAPGGNDAPGRDPAGLPRLPLSQRLVSIQGNGVSPLLEIAVYRYAGSPENARRSYAEMLAREGWETLGRPGSGNFLNFGKAKSLLSLGIAKDKEEGVLITAAMLTQ